jgi:hypothetical protein
MLEATFSSEVSKFLVEFFSEIDWNAFGDSSALFRQSR